MNFGFGSEFDSWWNFDSSRGCGDRSSGSEEVDDLFDDENGAVGFVAAVADGAVVAAVVVVVVAAVVVVVVVAAAAVDDGDSVSRRQDPTVGVVGHMKVTEAWSWHTELNDSLVTHAVVYLLILAFSEVMRRCCRVGSKALNALAYWRSLTDRTAFVSPSS